MNPGQRAFLSAVVRFATLRHRPAPPRSREFGALRRALSEPPVGARRPEWQQRAYWRMPFPPVPAMLRAAGLELPCHLVDLGADGARISATVDIGHIAAVDTQVILSLRPERSSLRLELPATIVHHELDTASAGLAFRAAPLVTHHRDTLGHAGRHLPPSLAARAMFDAVIEPRHPQKVDAHPIVSPPHLTPANTPPTRVAAS